MADPPADGILAQILIKQVELGTQLAVISEQLKDLPDHETRLRQIERSVPSRFTWLRDIALLTPMYALVIDLIVNRR